MKRMILATIIVAVLLSGCDSKEGYSTFDYKKFECMNHCRDSLYYHNETKIIYIILSDRGNYQGYGFMSPYYSKNGKLCRYVDGEIVEVD